MADECLRSWVTSEDQTVVVHGCSTQPFRGRRRELVRASLC
ncbi:hypothetical protein HMPREF9598_01241 [Cutibacterium acnes HL050PA1]|nr:hypothetical protein HMPREF9598_01241 [Cutibacterium acnes HL050PA1]